MGETLSDAIIFEKNHRCGVMTLNRPDALNAFTLEMVQSVQKQYLQWQSDNEIYCIIQKSSSNRAFCAGADVRALYQVGQDDSALAKQFFHAEYALNWQLDRFIKPNIAFIDGIVMGGGVGISQYGTHRVGGEDYKFAMPETAIGLFPDIGSASFLSRMPLSVGIYLALTGQTITVSDAYWLKLITNFIPLANRAGIEEALSEGMPVDQLLYDVSELPEESELFKQSQWIDSCFSASTLEAIIERLERVKDGGKAWAQDTLAMLEQKSPLSLKITHAHLKYCQHRNLKRTLKSDYDLVCRFMDGQDFYEGVRALLVDKDKAPKWQHASLEAISKEEVALWFEKTEGNEDEEQSVPSRLALV